MLLNKMATLNKMADDITQQKSMAYLGSASIFKSKSTSLRKLAKETFEYIICIHISKWSLAAKRILSSKRALAASKAI